MMTDEQKTLFKELADLARRVWFPIEYHGRFQTADGDRYLRDPKSGAIRRLNPKPAGDKKARRRARRGLVAGALLTLLAAPAIAAPAELRATSISGLGMHLLQYDETSAANTALTMTTTTKAYGRTLRSVSVSCSASVTLTVTGKIVRRLVDASTKDVALPALSLSAVASAGAAHEFYLMPLDVVAVTVPAGGVGVTCTAHVVEEGR